jgi:AbrB family looped-hinge helix DNA binding protein
MRVLKVSGSSDQISIHFAKKVGVPITTFFYSQAAKGGYSCLSRAASFVKMKIVVEFAETLYPNVRTGMGWAMERETEIDERGRIVIPSQIREELKLRPKQKLKIETRDRQLILRPMLDPERFIKEMKGCVSGSKIKPGRIEGRKSGV